MLGQGGLRTVHCTLCTPRTSQYLLRTSHTVITAQFALTPRSVQRVYNLLYSVQSAECNTCESPHHT